jgi:hypothetical protein
MVTLATDGFADSLKNPPGEIVEFYKFITKKGVREFRRHLAGALKEITESGVGDDISLTVFLLT